MRVFVTGASGFVGSAVVPELIAAGHQVIGLARSDASAEAVAAAGAEPHRGALDDLDSLRAGAAAADGVIHLAFIHDFSDYESAQRADLAAIDAFGETLAGSGKPLVIASGLAGHPPGHPLTERDMPAEDAPRAAAARNTLALAERDVRSVVLRLSPTVHGPGDHGFVRALIGIARDRGVAGYVDDGEGANHWAAVHRLDAARLFRLAVERAPAGSVLHGVAEEGVPTRTIAEIIGRHLGLPTASVPAEKATEHFGWLGRFFALDIRATNALTRDLLDWHPTGLGLVDDLEEGHYFAP
ncbi:SDR family oxidoreductase [Streptomyces mayteni]